MEFKPADGVYISQMTNIKHLVAILPGFLPNDKAKASRGRISNWGQIGRLQVAATIAKSTCVDYTPKLKCTRLTPHQEIISRFEQVNPDILVQLEAAPLARCWRGWSGLT